MQTLQCQPIPRRWKPGIEAVCLAASLLVACAGDEKEVLVGSGQVVERTTEVMTVSELKVALPFEGKVSNGVAGSITLRGESNLLDRIEVRERAVSKWEIVAPSDLMFEQHDDIEISVPFIEMVKISHSPSIHLQSDIRSTPLEGP